MCQLKKKKNSLLAKNNRDMVLGFKPQFVESVLNGTKIHTIREDKGNRWTVGKKIHFATGVRTKNYNQFKEGECIGLQKIVISPAYIEVSGRELTYQEIIRLAQNDGFDSVKDMLVWFNGHFKGIIIHWTDYLY